MGSYQAGVLGCLLLLLAQQAVASDWREIGARAGMSVSLDFESIAPRGKHMRVWLRFDYAQPQKTVTYPVREYLSDKQLWAYDCAEKTLATVQWIYSAEALGNGEVVGSGSVPWDRVQFNDVPPDTLAEHVMRLVCARRSDQAPAQAPPGKK
jgi:hypothetical protein